MKMRALLFALLFLLPVSAHAADSAWVQATTTGYEARLVTSQAACPVLHTPKGDLTELRIFEPAFDSSTARKHFVETREDYERLWSYLEDAVVLENYDQYYRDCAELGDDGIPKTEIERTPWQQLWIEWVGLEPLSYHLADWPEHVEHTLELLEHRAQQTFEIAARSPAPFIVMVDNITASAIGPAPSSYSVLASRPSKSQRSWSTIITTSALIGAYPSPLVVASRSPLGPTLRGPS